MKSRLSIEKQVCLWYKQFILLIGILAKGRAQSNNNSLFTFFGEAKLFIEVRYKQMFKSWVGGILMLPPPPFPSYIENTFELP